MTRKENDKRAAEAANLAARRREPIQLGKGTEPGEAILTWYPPVQWILLGKNKILDGGMVCGGHYS